jgi:hypothetical protein
MTRCTECDVILGRGQCVSCWKERDNPSPLNSKRAKKAPQSLDGHPLDGSTAQRFIDHATEMANKTMAKMRNAAMTKYPIANMPNGDKPAKFTKTGTNAKSAVPFIDPLTVPLQLGLTAEIKAVKGMGLGAFALGKVKKGQLITHYDGHRVDPVTGMIYMTCSKMTHCISKLSDDKKKAISLLRYSKKWAVNVNCVSGARVAVDGTIACSEILNDVENRAGIGFGAFLNSSVGTGISATCKIIWIPRKESFTMSNFFFATIEERMQPVLVAVCDMEAGDQFTWPYTIAAHPVEDSSESEVESQAPQLSMPSVSTFSAETSQPPPASPAPSSLVPVPLAAQNHQQVVLADDGSTFSAATARPPRVATPPPPAPPAPSSLVQVVLVDDGSPAQEPSDSSRLMLREYLMLQIENTVCCTVSHENVKEFDDCPVCKEEFQLGDKVRMECHQTCNSVTV